MTDFIPRSGAAGFQLSNPSAIDLAAVVASLQIFNQTTMTQLRQKSMRLTKFLEDLLTSPDVAGREPRYSIITPKDPSARGAQLSIRLQPGLLETVLEVLERNGVVVDERKPDVIRVAPAPLYNTFVDVWNFCKVLRQAIDEAQ